jgi:hypothetical protein
MSKIREFIEENSIEFHNGVRNATMVVLIGYSQFLRITKEELKAELDAEIKADRFIGDEIDRLWSYCKSRRYDDWWTTEEATSEFVF